MKNYAPFLVIAAMLVIAFAINAGVMWLFASQWGFSPVFIAGLLGVGHATNSIFSGSSRR